MFFIYPGMSGNHFWHFVTGTGREKKYPGVRDGNGKYKKLFPKFGTGTGNTRNHSGVRDENGKTQIPFPLNGTGTEFF